LETIMLFSILFGRGRAASASSATRQQRSTPLGLERLEDRTVPSGLLNSTLTLGSGSILAAAAQAAHANPSAAVSLPMHGHGTGTLSPTFDFTASGTATHLGAFTHYGTLTLTPTLDPNVFQVSGITTYEAANGDKLKASLSGTLDLSTGVATGTDTWLGDCSTGRFANATGSAEVTAQLLGGGAFEFTLDGDIKF
jgi:hypothetical protein